MVSDEEMAPDDEHGYRESLKDAFDSFGIHLPRPGDRVVSLSQSEISYEHLNFTALQSDPEEVHRFIWENAQALTIDTQYDTRIERVEPSIRVGPDGFVIHEISATYVQHLEASADELSRLSNQAFRPPDGMSRDTMVQVWGEEPSSSISLDGRSSTRQRASPTGIARTGASRTSFETAFTMIGDGMGSPAAPLEHNGFWNSTRRPVDAEETGSGESA